MARIPWYLTNGQSLAVGATGSPPISTVTENANAKTIGSGGAQASLVAASVQRPDISMGYRMADHLAVLAAFNTVGQGSQTLAALSKGGATGRYEASVTKFQQGRTTQGGLGNVLAPAGVYLNQGEADENANTDPDAWIARVAQLLADYRTDFGATTGFVETFPLLMSQTASWRVYDTHADICVAQLKAARTLDGVWLACPQYQLTYNTTDHIHMEAVGYYHLGELVARAFIGIEEDGGWSPVAPVSITIVGTTITIVFHVPVAPLVFDTTAIAAQTNMGFSLEGTAATITAVAITAPDTVTITTNVPATGAQVGYGVSANNGYQGLGNLRDSEPATSVYDAAALPNWAVIFRDGAGTWPVVYPDPDPDPDPEPTPDRGPRTSRVGRRLLTGT